MSGVSDGSGGLRAVHHIDLWVSALSRGRAAALPSAIALTPSAG